MKIKLNIGKVQGENSFRWIKGWKHPNKPGRIVLLSWFDCEWRQHPERKIKERIAKGNGAYYANKTPFKSKLVSRNSKLKLYRSIISSIVVYGCKTWVLKENNRQDSVFERKILRKIFGPTKEHNGTWRIKTNRELDELTQHRSIIINVKSQRLSWFGHINRKPESIILKKIYKWQPFTN